MPTKLPVPFHLRFREDVRAWLAGPLGRSGSALCERLTYAVDRLVLAALDEALVELAGASSPASQAAQGGQAGLAGLASAREALPERWALMALGGYGRQQMSLRSDVDLQIVMPDGAADPGPLMEAFIGRLMRLGFRLGHGVRTVSESLLLARSEPTFATAILTARHLAGDPSATESVRAPVYQYLSGPGLAHLLDYVAVDRQKRAERLGDTTWVLEPDLKHGIGGLRDAQLVGWLALATGRPFDRNVAFAEDVLLRIRMALHALVAFKMDRLAFDYQDQVAHALGYADDRVTGPEGAAIALMRDAHLAMRTIASHAQRHLEITADRLRSPPRTPLDDAPGYVRVASRTSRIGRADGAAPRDIPGAIDALRVVLATGLPLEATLEGAFHDLAAHLASPHAGDGDLAPSGPAAGPHLGDLVLELLVDTRPGASRALHTLHRTGLLVTLVPEFDAVLGRIQRDLYHVFTVDEHILRAVDKLKALARDEHPELTLATERLKALSADPTHYRALMLATFLHDLGKGYGAGHHERGAELVEIIGPRLGFFPSEVTVAGLLVLHQADMPLVALRRDLADPRPIRGLARIVGDLATLDALYLLSVADWSSVGPETFSAWQQSVLDALYLKTKELLGAPAHWGIYADPKGVADELRQALLLVELGALPQAPGAESDPIDDFCSALPTRYFQNVDPAAMRAHYHLWRRYQADHATAVDVTTDRAHGQAIASVASADAPGLLARIAGGLAAAGADVVAAEIHSLAGGAVLDVFRIADPHARFTSARGAAALADRVTRAVAGEPLAEAPPGEFSARAALPPVPPQVAPTNDAASDHSVIDVVTGDRPGLLRDIARFLHGAGVSVDLAFVTTEGRVARDTFYVVDGAGAKLDDERLGALAETLAKTLEGELTTR